MLLFSTDWSVILTICTLTRSERTQGGSFVLFASLSLALLYILRNKEIGFGLFLLLKKNHLKSFKKTSCPWNCRYRFEGLYNPLTDFGKTPYWFRIPCHGTHETSLKIDKEYMKRWTFERTRRKTGRSVFSKQTQCVPCVFCCKRIPKHFCN